MPRPVSTRKPQLNPLACRLDINDWWMKPGCLTDNKMSVRHPGNSLNLWREIK